MQAPFQRHPPWAVLAQPNLGTVYVGVNRFTEPVVKSDDHVGAGAPQRRGNQLGHGSAVRTVLAEVALDLSGEVVDVVDSEPVHLEPGVVCVLSVL